jgi:hypothetical protein
MQIIHSIRTWKHALQSFCCHCGCIIVRTSRRQQQIEMEHTTLEILASTPLPDGELRMYNPPSDPSFSLTPSELKEIMPEHASGKRMRLRKCWTGIFRSHLSKVTPYTTRVFNDSCVCSQLKPTAPHFKATGVCGASYCNTKIECYATKVHKHTVHCKIYQVE